MEAATWGTRVVVQMFGEKNSVIGQCALNLHSLIAVLGMLGYLIDVVLDGAEHVARRLTSIRQLCRHGNARRGN
jgi:uncharacterized membrane protein YciS (DUF1049 family)